MKAINDYVIFKTLKQQKTSTGIFLNNIDNIGVVYELANTLTELKRGDLIIFDNSKCHSFSYNEEQFLACKITDIIVVIEK